MINTTTIIKHGHVITITRAFKTIHAKKGVPVREPIVLARCNGKMGHARKDKKAVKNLLKQL